MKTEGLLRRQTTRLTIVLLILMLSLLLLPVRAVQGQEGGNLLLNPGFEGAYQSYSSPTGEFVSEFRIAWGWHPWYRPRFEGEPLRHYRRPEYRPGSYSYNGTMSQQFFTSFGTHQAGLVQRVETATPGEMYRFGVAVYIWSSQHGNFLQSVDPGGVHVRVGIDPSGGTNPWAAEVVWSPFATFYDEWRVLTVDAEALSNALTVFIWSQVDNPVEHNDVAVDESYLGLAETAPVVADEGIWDAGVGVDVAVVDGPVAEETPAVQETPSASPTGATYTGNVDLRLRDRPYGQVLDVIPAGTPVAVIGRSEDRNWAQVHYNGQDGWVGSWLGRFSIPFNDLPVVPLP